MAERRVKVVFSAEVQNYKAAMEAAAKSTEKLRKSSEDTGKASEEAGKRTEGTAKRTAEEIAKVAAAHQEAAKAQNLQYAGTGQLVDMNGKALNSQQAAAVGLQTFSQEAYLAGRSAEEAGAAAEAAATATAEATKAAAEAEGEHAAALEDVATTAGLTGAAVVAGVGLAVKAYADFDKQMSSVDAATHETAANMDLLRQAAIDAGADTAFSASEAAQGIEELAKAGVSTKDILAGGLNGALALAAAGSLGVGDAAEIAASALTQFKLSGDQVPHLADLLAAGAGKAQGSVEDLGAALNQSGLIAAQTGLTIEETTGGLAAFASAGLVGSDAGTSFKTMLMSLTPSSKQAGDLMRELGLSAYDSQGQFIGLSEYAGVLQDSLKGMSDEQRNSTLKTIFGSDAIRAAAVLYEQGSAGVQKWEDAVNDAGYAADTAGRMQDNLAGDLEKLGGAFDTALIKSGSGASEVLRGLVKGLEGMVDVVGSIPAPTLSVGLGLAGVAGGAVVLGTGLVALNTKIASTSAALALLAPAGTKAGTALAMAGTAAKLAGVAAGLGVATFAMAKLAESDYMSKIDTGMGNVNNALQDVVSSGPSAAKALDGLFRDRDGGDLINTVTDLESALKRTFNRDAGQSFNDWGESLVNGMTGVKGSSQMLGEQFERLDAGLSELVSGGKSEDAAKAFDKIKAAADAQDISIEDLTAKFPQYADALKQAEADGKKAGEGGDAAAAGISAAGDSAEVAVAAAEDMAKALEDIGLSADGTVTDLVKFADALVNAGLLQLSARDAARGFEDAIDAVSESIKTNGKTMDITTEKGRANQAALDAIAGAGINVVKANAANGDSQEKLQGNLQTTYDKLIAGAGQFGITGQAAIDLAREVLKVPPGVSIESWMSDAAKRMAEATTGAVNGVPDSKTVKIHVQYTESGTAIRDRAGDAGMSNRVQAYATGGRLPGYADGGQLPTSGPGTGMTDGFLGISSAGVPLARVDAGEWIINRGSSGRYNRELAAINAGTFPKLPGYATGGMFAAGSFAGSAGGGAVTVSAPAVTVMIGNEQLDARMYRVAGSAISSADSQSQFSRKGR